MRLNDDVYVLVLPFMRDGQPFPINLALVMDAEHGPTLVDTGLPGQEDAIAGALAEAGVLVQDVRRIVLTHQDIDHVGSLHGLVEASGARVLAGEVEAPFIDGTELARFATPEVVATRPELRQVMERFQWTPVDEALPDGARLDVAGGLRAIFTPGHTRGHMCVYAERTGTLIAGDALTAADGRLLGPSAAGTRDMPAARASVGRLAELDVRAIVCYHGGVVVDDAGAQLRRLAEELSAVDPQQPS
jgi:glyoxylase-like metal-dependent hydrolase (beta-lactamase superfamily II)